MMAPEEVKCVQRANPDRKLLVVGEGAQRRELEEPVSDLSF